MTNPFAYLIEELNQANLWEERLTFKRKAFVKMGGSVDTNLYYVLSGSLHIYVIDGVEENTIRFGYQGDLIAALDSFILEEPSDFYIQTLKKTELLSIQKSKFIEFIESSNHRLKTWQSILSNLIVSQMERERDLLTSSPKERFERVLIRSPRLFQEIPGKYIASYLRMTPETFSRMKKS